MERDQTASSITSMTLNFNSHAHVERDYLSTAVEFVEEVISTHTLTWSVTAQLFGGAFFYKDFNSHAHVERDSLWPVPSLTVRYFNSHAHVERD